MHSNLLTNSPPVWPTRLGPNIIGSCCSAYSADEISYPQVAREVFNNCLMGELKNTTRILVTNQLQFVSPADIAIFMANGKIAEIGTYSELMAKGEQFAQLMSQAEVHISHQHVPTDCGQHLAEEDLAITDDSFSG